MASNAQKEPSWIGGPTKGLGTNEYTNKGSLETRSSFKRTQILIKLAPQDFTTLTPSVKRPLFSCFGSSFSL